MFELIKTSTQEDLRQPEWELIDFTNKDGFIVTTHKDKASNTVYRAKTRLSSYEDVFGKLMVQYQELYKFIPTKTE